MLLLSCMIRIRRLERDDRRRGPPQNFTTLSPPMVLRQSAPLLAAAEAAEKPPPPLCCEECTNPFFDEPRHRCLACSREVCYACCSGIDIRAVGACQQCQVVPVEGHKRCQWKALKWGPRRKREALVLCDANKCIKELHRFNALNSGALAARLDLGRPFWPPFEAIAKEEKTRRMKQ